MAIKYYLQPNPITPDPNDQSARVVTSKVLGTDEIVSEMLRRGSTITEADIRAVLNVFYKVTIDEVVEGNSVNLPICNVRPGITGVFNSATDNYDRSRHTVKASISAGNELFTKILAAPVEKVLLPMPSPTLLEYTDVNTSSVNSKLTAGGIGALVGEELKFNPSNALEGIFFVSTADKKETKVTVLATRTEGKLMFSVPALPAGSYYLEVRKGYGGNGASLRGGILAEALTVA